MPTSSQAMILRGNEKNQRALVNVQFSAAAAKADDIPGSCSSNRVEKFENVKFDLNVTPRSSSNEHDSLNALEGVFAFDPTVNACKWQICTISPGNQDSTTSNLAAGKFESGHISSGDFNIPACVSSQTSGNTDSTTHYPTPNTSAVDNVSSDNVLLAGTASMDSKDITESDAYQRLEDLGFRKRLHSEYRLKGPGRILNLGRPRHLISTLASRCSSQIQNARKYYSKRNTSRLSIETFDTGKNHTSQEHANDEAPMMGSAVRDNVKKRIHHPKPKSLLDEVKESVNWQGRVVHIALPRPVSARIHVNTVVFSLRDARALAHMEVKRLVEKQIGYEVTELQFDPVSMRTSDPNVLDRWIVTFGSKEHCYLAIAHGLEVEGDTLSVRPWEDIAHEEMFGDTDRSHTTYRYQSNKALRKLLNLA